MPSELHAELMELRGKKVELLDSHRLAGRTGVVMEVHPNPPDHPVEGALLRVRLDGTTGNIAATNRDVQILSPVDESPVNPKEVPPGEPDGLL